MTLIPAGQEADSNGSGTPLKITKAQAKKMLDKARELLTEPMEEDKLCGLLEQHYVAKNLHYTSAQLKGIVMQLAEELKPEPVAEELEAVDL